MSSGSKQPPVPRISDEERDLFRKQGQTLDQVSELLSEERIDSEQSRDLLRSLTGIFDTEGNLDRSALNDLRSRVQATREIEQGIGQDALGQLQVVFDPTRTEQISQQVGQAEAQRLLNALQGTEPSAALRNEEQRAFEQLREGAGQRGIRIQGDDLFSATSQGTAGNQLLSELRRNAEARRDAERQSIINQATQANLNRLGFGLQNRGFNFNAAQALRPNEFGQTAGQLGTASQLGPGRLTGQFLGLGQGFQQAAQPFRDQRLLQFQGDLQGAANRRASRSAGLGLLGGLAGGGIGFALGGPVGAGLGFGAGSGIGQGFGAL